jgi:predicted nuclease of predicted toxin-antitoxin system
MKIWVDAHISPGVAAWINEKFPYKAQSLTGLGLRDAKDSEIFEAARVADVILISKDSDFLDMIGQFGCPPKLILLRCGNTTNQRLREIFGVHLQDAINRLVDGESVVELE